MVPLYLNGKFLSYYGLYLDINHHAHFENCIFQKCNHYNLWHDIDFVLRDFTFSSHLWIILNLRITFKNLYSCARIGVFVKRLSQISSFFSLYFEQWNCSLINQLYFTVNGLIFMGYKLSWFSWRVLSTNSSTNERSIMYMIYEGKYNSHKFCGWLYFRGYQFSWIEQTLHIRGVQNSWP